jgi:hypothetical protein
MRGSVIRFPAIDALRMNVPDTSARLDGGNAMIEIQADRVKSLS